MAIEAVFFSCWGQLAKQQLARVSDFFLYISLPFLHNYDVKMPNFAFSGDGNQAKTKFYFVFELGYFNSDSGGFAYIWQSKWVEIIVILKDRKNAISLFKRRSRCRRVLGSWSPYQGAYATTTATASRFLEDGNTTILLFFSWTSMHSFRIQLLKNSPTFDELNEME